jgi:hypothetical protein
MPEIKKVAREALKRGKAGAAEVRKVGKSAAKAGAKAGFKAAAAVIAIEMLDRLNGTKAIKAKKAARRKKIAAAVAGAAAVTAAGIAVARSRRKK